MATGCTTVNLGLFAAKPEKKSTLLELLLTFEAWLDSRASRRDLYRMDDRELADIGLSRADVEGLNETSSWQNYWPSTGR